MSKYKLDWSNAPEGATHYATQREPASKWLKVKDGDVYFWQMIDNIWMKYSCKVVSKRHLTGALKRPKPTKAELGWKRHRGGKCPVPIFTKIEIRYRSGLIVTREVSGLMADPCIWEHMTGITSEIDIMAYRILE